MPRALIRYLATSAFLAAVLCACSETVLIKGYPPGAKAYVDGEFIGTTPAYTKIPRDEVSNKHTWRVDFRNCDPIEGPLVTRVAAGRIVGYVFTAGILAIFKSPRSFLPVDVALTGGDCEPQQTTAKPAPAPPGITVQQIVGDRNLTTGASGDGTTKTQRLAERLRTLRDLYNRKLISKETYESESQKAIKDLTE